MKISNYSAAELEKSYGMDVTTLDTGAAARLGVAATWVSIEPGARSDAHQHDETETWVIVSGSGVLTVDAEPHPVRPSTVVQFEPFETHSVENTGETDLVLLSLYWRDTGRAARAAADTGHRRFGTRPLFVFSSAPTPNGDLHLGHLSGPFFGADVFVRYQRMNGADAWHITGSDDYQNYVVAAARREGRSPAETAAHYSAEILATLGLMDIDVHQYTVTSQDDAYPEALRAFFSRLTASGVVAPRTAPALYDAVSGEYLYESGVTGRCAACGEESGGNVCETCLEPNVCTDLTDPRSTTSDAPPREGSATRYTLPLHRLAEDITAHHRLGRVPAPMKELAERLSRRAELDIPVTHAATWGVQPAETAVEGQVIWSWLDYAFSILHGIEAIGRDLGRSWKANEPEQDWKIVHFLGSDGSFFHPMFVPALYRLAHPDWTPDIDYHINEFYLLDDTKFSTSRRHVIWGKDILSPRTVDAIRFYLALTRPEGRRTTFERDAYESYVRQTLIGTWQGWLNGLGDRIEKRYGGTAPDAGVWTPEHAAFLARLETRLSAVTGSLGQDGFSLNRAAETLNGMVEDVTAFSRLQAPAADVESCANETRTAIALELAAARLLATCATPVMPRFAARLAAALGGPPPAEWPSTVDLVPAGTTVDLARQQFFADPGEHAPDPDAAPRSGLEAAAPGTTAPTGDAPPLLPWLSDLVRQSLRLPDDKPVRDTSLVQLGMESLQAIALQYQITEHVGADVPMEDLLGAKTVADLATLIADGMDPDVVAAQQEVTT
ncbi:class I tRNA ligase family protein [Streptomyces sp. NPDC059134]|uniref:class I tRNA ligase family protein n=1 Tax=Streptomyces sp. NPDC059134 TaxID=3346738 RepID=UPI00369ED9E3